jgi:hypothetical protein
MFSKTIVWYLGLCSSLLSAQANDSIPSASAHDTPSAHLGVLCIDKLPGPDAWSERGLGSSTAVVSPAPEILDSTGISRGTKRYAQGNNSARHNERPVYFASVDGGEWKKFSQDSGNCVPDLSTKQRHTIRVIDAQRQPVASFSFRFEPGVTAMHVYYYSFYNSWIVDNVPKRRIEKILGTANADISCAVCR